MAKQGDDLHHNQLGDFLIYPSGLGNGDDDAWLVEVIAANVFFLLNDSRNPHTESFVVFMARALGPGCRAAFFLTNFFTFTLFIWVQPELVAKEGLNRGNGAGDFLANATFFLYLLYSLMGLVGRILPRVSGMPAAQSTRVPEILLGDALPDKVNFAWWLVFGAEVFKLTLCGLATHTILIGAYKLRLPNFAWLLALQTSYVLVSAVDSISRVGTPFGIPSGGAKKTAMLRAIVLVPFLVFFSVWTIVVSRVYSW